MPTPFSRTAALALSLAIFGAAACREEEEPAMAKAGMAGLGEDGEERAGEAREPLKPDDKVATVGDEVLSKKDLDRAVNSMLQAVGVPPDRVDAQMRKMVEARAMEAMIKRVVLHKEAERRGHVVTPDEINKAVEGFSKTLPEALPFDTWLARMSLTEEDFREELEVNSLVRKLQAEVTGALPPPSEEDLKALYEKRKEQIAVVKKGRAHQILIKVSPDAPMEMVDAARKKAEEIRGELDGKGLEAFKKAARKKSQDAETRKQGGDLGTFEAREVLPDFWMAFSQLEEGEISAPVRTDKGFHLIYGQGVEEGKVRSFEEVQPQLVLQLSGVARAKAMDELLQGLLAKAEIRRHYLPPPPPSRADLAAQGPGGEGEGPAGGAPPAGMPSSPPGGMPGGGMPGGGMPGGGQPGGMPGKGMPGGGQPHGMPAMPADGDLPLPSADNVLPGVRNPHGGGGGMGHGGGPGGAPGGEKAAPGDLRLKQPEKGGADQLKLKKE